MNGSELPVSLSGFSEERERDKLFVYPSIFQKEIC